MNREEALSFLRDHQPMPPDGEITEEMMSRYEEVRRYFLENPVSECVPLFLNSFGDGSGFGIYQLVEDVFAPLPELEVIGPLKSALRSPHRGVRYWSAQVAQNYPDASLVTELSSLLSGLDADERAAAATALGFIEDDRVDDILDQAVRAERDAEVRKLLQEIIADR